MLLFRTDILAGRCKQSGIRGLYQGGTTEWQVPVNAVNGLLLFMLQSF